MTNLKLVHSREPIARNRDNPLRAAERAYLEALSMHGFQSPECAAALVALRRLRQAGRDFVNAWPSPTGDFAA